MFVFVVYSRYVYGHDNTDSLSFGDADDLLFAAEKYMISELKDKLISRLTSLLTYHNICSLMNNPVCYQALELNSAITKVRLIKLFVKFRCLSNLVNEVLWALDRSQRAMGVFYDLSNAFDCVNYDCSQKAIQIQFFS